MPAARDQRPRSPGPDLDTQDRRRSPLEEGWARWNRSRGQPYTVGVEEEVMLLAPSGLPMAQCGESVLRRLPEELAAHTAPETHSAVIELATGVHSDVAGAVSLPRFVPS
jgi:hypothetical protein